jgi:hypothetical protein
VAVREIVTPKGVPEKKKIFLPTPAERSCKPYMNSSVVSDLKTREINKSGKI